MSTGQRRGDSFLGATARFAAVSGLAMYTFTSTPGALAEEKVIVYAKVRDFQISGAQKHPDFESFSSCNGKGAVGPRVK